jgi:hypothetical protein
VVAVHGAVVVVPVGAVVGAVAVAAILEAAAAHENGAMVAVTAVMAMMAMDRAVMRAERNVAGTVCMDMRTVIALITTVVRSELKVAYDGWRAMLHRLTVGLNIVMLLSRHVVPIINLTDWLVRHRSISWITLLMIFVD